MLGIVYWCLFPLLECSLELRKGVVSVSLAGDKLGLGPFTERLSSCRVSTSPIGVFYASVVEWIGGVLHPQMCGCLLPRTLLTILVLGPGHLDSPAHEVR